MNESTDTGRFNCQRPNAQNMPRKTNDPIGVRSFIKAPDGHLILSLDFSQIELRVGAFYCRDATMMDTYRMGGDIHAATTSVIFGCTYEEAQDKHREGYKEQRTIAKNVNFGTFYGLFPNGLQRTLKFKAGVDKSVQECEEIIRNLKAGYPDLTRWQENTPTFGFEIFLPDGTPYEPEDGDSVVFAAKQNKHDETPAFTIEADMESRTITFKEENTKHLEIGKYIWELSLNKENGYRCTFLANKKLNLTVEVA